VLLELITFIVGGTCLVTRFCDARKFLDEGGREWDRFFKGARSGARVNRKVTVWLKELRWIAWKRRFVSINLINFLLGELKSKYLVVNLKARKSAGDACILPFTAAKTMIDDDGVCD
jgi:hypothetical protein